MERTPGVITRICRSLKLAKAVNAPMLPQSMALGRTRLMTKEFSGANNGAAQFLPAHDSLAMYQIKPIKPGKST